MSGRKNILVTFGFAAAVSLIASAVAVLLFTYHYSRQQFELVNLICGRMVEQEPEALKIISAALKEFKDGNAERSAERNESGSAEGSAERNESGSAEGSVERNKDGNAVGNIERSEGGSAEGSAERNEGGNAVGSAERNVDGNTEGSTERNESGNAEISIERSEDVIVEGNIERNTEGNTGGMGGKDILGSLGYGAFDLSKGAFAGGLLYTGAGLLTGIALLCVTFLYRNRKEAGRIQALADYLEQAESGKATVLAATGEDAFYKLEDEIYKTVTSLYHTRDRAVQARNDFAENLSNIAHQIKTPITAMSLSVQMIKQDISREYGNKPEELDLGKGDMNQPEERDLGREDMNQPEERKQPEVHAAHKSCQNKTGQQSISSSHLEQVEKQLLRLTRLEEALLVLSRIDAGTLVLQKKEVDVFTLLVLAADNLQEFFAGSGASADIPELGEMMITVDLDWTMEAVMNLMKNCLEHGNGGTVHCSYKQNPLYTEILIWDEGEGFVKEDIPYLFERFYRGKNAGEGGIGIGLALAREIIERQNGTIRAGNRQEGGACFEIHFYRHK